MRSVCVFCGSNPGNDPVYAAGARAMGAEIARRGLTLVYGGGAVGLMGIVANAAMEAGGEVHGVIPQALARRAAHRPARGWARGLDAAGLCRPGAGGL
ncbi:LOG family protein [Bosea thiooxidans]